VEEFRITGGSVGVVRSGETGVHCVYCEQLAAPPGDGHVVGNWTGVDELAGILRMLEDRDCRAIHWVAATPCLPFLVSALAKAAKRKLSVPIGVSTNGYIRGGTLALLSGLIDSYQVELKYADSSDTALPEYAEHARLALKEMYRQVGSDWVQASDGTLLRGLLVHMRVYPDDLARLRSALGWLRTAIGRDVTVCLRASPRLHTLGDVDHHVDPVRSLSAFEWHVARSSLEEMLPGGRHLFLEPERFAG
jgi:putative pyruvate formate lyase activating enzyme